MGQPSDCLLSVPIKQHNLELWLRFSLNRALLLPRNPSLSGLVKPCFCICPPCWIVIYSEQRKHEWGVEEGGKNCWGGGGHRVESLMIRPFLLEVLNR